MYPVLVIPLIATICQAQYIVTTSVDNAGNTYWSPTVGAPRTSVRGRPTIPTLGYNCAIVPATCNNIAQLRPGAQLGNYGETFGWDPDKERKKLRGKAICPANWKKPRGTGKKKTARCPETNQPELHPLGVTNAVPPEVEPKDLAVLTEDANGQTVRTGIMMSCDEFPPAMSIQGGIGPPGGPINGATYCSPSKYLVSQAAQCHSRTKPSASHVWN